MSQPTLTKTFKSQLYDVIFEADTRTGKLFDITLIFLILGSTIIVFLDSVPSIRETYGTWFYGLEWLLTGIFTLEYLLRLYCVQRPPVLCIQFFWHHRFSEYFADLPFFVFS